MLFATFITSTMLNSSVSADASQDESAAVAPSQSMNHAMSIGEWDTTLLTVQDVSNLLGVACVSVYRLVARHALPTYRVLRRIRFRREDVLAWIETNRTPVRSPRVCP